METGNTIFIVEDDKSMRLLLEMVLGKANVVESFESAESCLARLESERPQLFLCDVGLPGMDGYALCRALKDMPESKDIPVVFLSGHDSFESIMAGYDAGGEDYMVKPFQVEEVLRKVSVAMQRVQVRLALEQQAKEAQKFSFMVMATMDEGGIALNFMCQLVAWETEQDIAAGLLELLQRYQLDGVIQTRIAGRSLTYSAAGINVPLEVSVMNHVSGMDRIFDFGKRSVHNFERVTLMVSNLPLDNPDYCGRLRDNLSIAAKGAESKLQSLEALEANEKIRSEIHGLLGAISATMQSYQQQNDAARYQGAVFRAKILEDLLVSFARLGMSEQQEDEILTMVTERTISLTGLYDIGGETQATFGELSKKLENILAATVNR